MSKKKKPRNRQKQLRCPYCGSAMTLRPASDIYDDRESGHLLYVCNRYPLCDTYVNTHPGTRTPLGIPANGELRHLRILAHRMFDQIWQTGIMSREQAYRWMADHFCLRLKDAHIGHFSEYSCRTLIRECEAVLMRNGRLAKKEIA